MIQVSTSEVEFSNGAWSLCSSTLVPQPMVRMLLLLHAVNFWCCCLAEEKEVRNRCLQTRSDAEVILHKPHRNISRLTRAVGKIGA